MKKQVTGDRHRVVYTVNVVHRGSWVAARMRALQRDGIDTGQRDVHGVPIKTFDPARIREAAESEEPRAVPIGSGYDNPAAARAAAKVALADGATSAGISYRISALDETTGKWTPVESGFLSVHGTELPAVPTAAPSLFG